jgi:hypothetical protein
MRLLLPSVTLAQERAAVAEAERVILHEFTRAIHRFGQDQCNSRPSSDVDLATSCDIVLSNGNGDELSLHREDRGNSQR